MQLSGVSVGHSSGPARLLRGSSKHLISPQLKRRFLFSSSVNSKRQEVIGAADSTGSYEAEPFPGRSLSASWRVDSDAAAKPQLVPDLQETPKEMSETLQSSIKEYLLLWVGLGLLYTIDFLSKKAFIEAGIQFPNALAGMFVITGVLIAMGEKNAAVVRAFFAPSLDWIAKWLPLFYVATLVILPLSIKGLTGDVLFKIFAIVSTGMIGTLLFTAQAASFIRSVVNTESKELIKSKPASPFTASHLYSWGIIASAALACALSSPTGFGATMALPFSLACTVIGFLLGNKIPSNLHAVLPPVIVTGFIANVAAALYGSVIGSGSYEESLKLFCSKGAGPMGAGDLLLSFLGSVILSMGFRIYDQRETMKRHAPEILGATFLSALFSFISTAFAAKAIGLQPDIARALLPRCVTVALAMPIAGQLDAPISITASAVMLSGVLGANIGVVILNAFGIRDIIARGLAMAAAAHGLGTAAIVSKEPTALPFCALSYSMVGIISTCLAAIPAFRALLISIVG